MAFKTQSFQWRYSGSLLSNGAGKFNGDGILDLAFGGPATPFRNDVRPFGILSADAKGEVGELRAEAEIKMGVRPGTPGKDGVKGEAIDLYLCALDMIFEDCSGITNREITEYAHEKLVKWEENYSNRTSKDE